MKNLDEFLENQANESSNFNEDEDDEEELDEVESEHDFNEDSPVE